eukprot:CCRYP_006842-RA/>CCRYP_006842-RA protein AED:0.03 eAED:0.03 QI:0/-1/0/1/-1/1/1/0/670
MTQFNGKESSDSFMIRRQHATNDHCTLFSFKAIILLTAVSLSCSKKASSVHTSFSTFVAPITPRSILSAKTLVKLCLNNEEATEWDDEVRSEVAHALVPVLFPQASSRRHSITAETALKKLLRAKYQRLSSSKGYLEKDKIESKTMDGSGFGSATLLLGTSVMRLRHWYVVATTRHHVSPRDKTPPIPCPFDASILSLLTGGSFDVSNVIPNESEITCSIVNHNNHSDNELLSFVSAMINEHCNYLSMNASLPLPLEGKFRQNPVLKLSLLFSMPVFLTEALLKRYGYSTTKDIFVNSNAPGPVTIRKNSIRFPGSDEKLGQWLLDEDGVHVLPLTNSIENLPFQQREIQEKLAIYASADGSNQFVIGSGPNMGTIIAPRGCLQILESDADATKKTAKKLMKSIWSMKGWQLGYFEVQDAGSQVIVHSLEAEPGDSILDYCAGNGGKTFGIASVLMERGYSAINDDNHAIISEIVAHDVADQRLRQIKGSMSRVGFVEQRDQRLASKISSFYTEQRDHGKNCRCNIRISTSSELESSSSSRKFDIVLVDAPCSSTGVLRRRPSQRWSLTEKEAFETLPELQLNILKEAAKFVKSGGKLVYSTCSLLKQENEDIVSAFEHSDVFQGSFVRWNFNSLESTVKDNSNTTEHHTLTIIPTAVNDGFFIARFKAL